MACMPLFFDYLPTSIYYDGEPMDGSTLYYEIEPMTGSTVPYPGGLMDCLVD